MELLVKYFPNLMNYMNEFLKSILETMIMLFTSGILVFIFGLIIGTLLVVTKGGNILENKFIHGFINKTVNIFRSIPFVIMLTLLIPITKMISGTYIGVKGAIFPLFVGGLPFFIRQVELALSDVDKGIIEASLSMGFSPFEIIKKVYLKESVPQIARAITITIISLLGLTAMGGAVGGGGIGAFVLRYGHGRRFHDITIISVIFILIFVSIIQGIGDYVVKKTTH